MTYQVQRGGTWFYGRKQQAYLRLAYRRVDKAHHVDDLVGFRVVCLPPEVEPPWMPLPVRGGSWSNNPSFCRSAYRNHYQPDIAINNIGFRVVCLLREVKPTQVAIRGGSHARLNYPWCRSTWCRSACRGISRPDYAEVVGYTQETETDSDDIGFRVIRFPPT